MARECLIRMGGTEAAQRILSKGLRTCKERQSVRKKSIWSLYQSGQC
jgi:hypothetical protein